MKISCTQENLNKALNQVTRIVNPRASLPVLSNILIKTENSRIKISATDLEIGINIWIGSKIEKQGSITIPAKVISEFVANCNDKTITLETDKNNLKISSEKYKASISGIDSEEFPLIPQIKSKPIAILEVESLKRAISQVLPACSLDDSRPILSGVLWKFTDIIKLVATDSYRLTEKKIQADKIEKSDQIVVPQKTMQEIERIISGLGSEKIEISIAENQARFTIGKNIEIVSRLIEGKYPDYEQIIPKKFTIECLVEKNELLNGLKIASFFAKESANNIKVDFNDKSINVSAEASQMGKIDSSIVSKNTGQKTIAAFNAQFFLDGLSAINSDTVEIRVSGELTPTIISDPKFKDYFYIIMPLRTD
jgi:DNA polymerase-3 subunit beta